MKSALREIWKQHSRTILVVYALLTTAVIAGNLKAYAQQTPPTPAPAAAAAPATPPPTPDPIGSATAQTGAAVNSGIGSVTADDLKALTDKPKDAATNASVTKALDSIGQVATSLNVAWMLITGFLVMFMQAGFALVETGFCRAKNAAHVMMTNFMIYPIGMLGYWIAGFAIMFGSVAATKIGGPGVIGGTNVLNGTEFMIGNYGIAGTKGFFLNGSVYDVGVYGLFLFQMVFMDTTATIPTGAMAERWRFSAFMVYGLFVSIICYPLYGHWVWGGGMLAMLGQLHNLGHGVVDFAGSSVVHAVGGFVALAGSIVLGPRTGKYTNGKPNVLAGHHLPMAMLGTFILAFGWFGFNPGSALAITGGNMRVAVIASNTMLASAGGALTAIMYMKFTTGKFDPGMAINGMLAGLVAITAPCAFVDATTSVLWVGGISGILVVLSCQFFEKIGVDDPVGAISVHGVCGIYGLLCVGLYADGSFGSGWNGVGADKYLGKAGQGVTGIFHGDSSQLIAQIIGAIVCMSWAFGSAFVFFKIQNAIKKIRPTVEEEIQGLDMPEMGSLAYPDFQIIKHDVA